MIIYLASPYSHPLFAMRRKRHWMACRLCSKLMQAGHSVFSPIVHSHMLTEWTELDDMDRAFWLAQDLPWLKAADALAVADMPGWKDSVGIQAEIAEARRLGKPVYMVDRETGDMREAPE